jgi:arylformamidase
MKVNFTIGEENYTADLLDPHCLGIPMRSGGENPNCFFADPPKFTPYSSGDFVGSIDAGSPVNFFDLHINPHGNGTHTECSGHVFQNGLVMAGLLKKFFFSCQLVSVSPREGGMITDKSLGDITPGIEAVALRTLPNEEQKITRKYSGKNPPFCEPVLLDRLAKMGVEHFLIDLPSVDPEQDDGLLSAHKSFWNRKHGDRTRCTITELIYVGDEINDGLYLLQLQHPEIAVDAVPSNPVLYRIEKID